MLAFAPGSFPASPEGWLDLLVVLSLKATAVLLLTAALTAILARASAASRHLAWSIGLVSLLALPPLAFWAPGFEVRGLAWPHSDDGAGLAIASSSAEAGSRVAKEPVTESPRTMDGGPVVRPPLPVR